MERHVTTQYYVVGEGVWRRGERGGECVRPSTVGEIRRFRFSRLVPRPYAPGEEPEPILSRDQAERLAVAMTEGDQPDAGVPAGYTYLGQFVDHDLTMDKTGRSLGEHVSVEELLQGRSPALDLDSLYGLGPSHPDSAPFYQADGASLKMGETGAVPGLPAFPGFDLPRRAAAPGQDGTALIPDHRNDENLAVAQTHLAFIRFHNRVVKDLAGSGWSSAAIFAEARRQVTLHYQWMLRHDYLPRVVDPAIVEDVFTNGRTFFEVPQAYGDYEPRRVYPGDTATMPVEFSVAAFRLGHSMVRARYQWNAVFNDDEANPRRLAPATLGLLFQFSGTSGGLGPTDPLPSNWIADFRRLFDFVGDAGAAAEFGVPGEQFNMAKLIDTRLVDPLRDLPPGSFGGNDATPAIERNLAFRNLLRADMIALAGGQEAAEFLRVEENRRLTGKQILTGNNGGVVLDPPGDWERFAERTPLWFYILREAEFHQGRLGPVGGRIVAEVFHRAMEVSRHSIVGEPWWSPHLGTQPGTFTMPHLLLYAFENNVNLLNPVG